MATKPAVTRTGAATRAGGGGGHAAAPGRPKAPRTKSTSDKATSRKLPAAAPRRTTKKAPPTSGAWGPAERTDALAKSLGGVTALARALDVSPSQPSRWKSGKESPGPEAARRLVDLDHVVARALLVWDPSVVPTWLGSPNAFLGGQTPLGVLATRGPAEVLDALEAFETGGFA